MAVDWLRHSCPYRAMYREGFIRGFTKVFPESTVDVRVECCREWLCFLGEEWLGLPSVEVMAKIDAITDESKLEALVERLAKLRLKITTWDELLATEFPSTDRATLR
jgi:hypothetical protein